jgi:hypothetical protein
MTRQLACGAVADFPRVTPENHTPSFSFVAQVELEMAPEPEALTSNSGCRRLRLNLSIRYGNSR